MRRSGLVSLFAGLLAGLVLAHAVAGASVRAVARALRRVPDYRGLEASARVPPFPLPDLAVVGSSLSAIDPRRPLLATALASALRVDATRVGSFAYPGRNIADVYAELLRASEAGIRTVLVELNPFIIGDRAHRLGAGRPDLVVVTEAERGTRLLPHLDGLPLRALVAQLGVEGTLDGIASGWWPTRFALPLYGGEPDSSIVGGLVPPLSRALLGSDPPYPPALGIDAAWQGWICPNFREKSTTGLDMDIVIAMTRAARTIEARVVFFVPPMNRDAIAHRCGPVAVERLEALVSQLSRLASQAAVALCDLSRTFDARPGVFADYGHFIEPSRGALHDEAVALLTCARLAPLP